MVATVSSEKFDIASGPAPSSTSNGPMLTWMYAVMFSSMHATKLSTTVSTRLHSFLHAAVSRLPYMAPINLLIASFQVCLSTIACSDLRH